MCNKLCDLHVNKLEQRRSARPHLAMAMDWKRGVAEWWSLRSSVWVVLAWGFAAMLCGTG